MSIDEPTKKKKRVAPGNKKTWTLREDPYDPKLFHVCHRDLFIGTIQPCTKFWHRWRFVLGGKLSFKSYESKELAMVGMRNRIRQRKCHQRKRERKESAS